MPALRTWSSLLLVLAAGACGAPAAEVEPAASATTRVRMTTGTPGAAFLPLGDALAQAYALVLPSVAIEIQESPGAVRNVQALQHGEADIGFTFADVAYFAYIGELREEPRPFDRLRGIAVLQMTPLHLMARPEAGIRSIRDLRGRRVGIGPPGSGTALTAGLLAEEFGIAAAEWDEEMLPFNEAARRLADGSIDAAFVNAAYPAESVAVATRSGSTLVPVDGPVIDRLRGEYPFLRLTFIPAGTYANQPAPVRTVGVDSLLVCRADLPDEIVYSLTKALFEEVLPIVSSQRVSLRQLDLDQAPATPMPLHAGATRYYRERELTR
jgi:TRAP transporter TAXI family solute receptor